MGSIGDFNPVFRSLLFIGAIVYFIIIFWLLKRGKLNIRYSIMWIGSAVVLLLFVIFPILLLHLSNITKIVAPSNLLFIMLFAFVLLLLLSLSTIVTGFAAKIKRLTQTQALLEKRIRELEDKLDDKQK